MAGKQSQFDRGEMKNPSCLIDERIRSLKGWRGEMLAGSARSSDRQIRRWLKVSNSEGRQILGASQYGNMTGSSALARRIAAR